MGKRSVEQVAREIEALRVDSDRVLTELETRFGETLNVRAQAERHPVALATVALALFGALSFAFYNLFFRTGHQAHEIHGRLEPSARSASGPPPAIGYGERPSAIGGLVKRVSWTFLATVLMTLASFAARKLSATMWSSLMHENPPKK